LIKRTRQRAAGGIRAGWPILTLVLLAACFIIGLRIGEQSLWFDEGWSAFAASQPDIVAAANADATNPPLYYMLLHAHARLLGDSEFSLRIFSLFAALLAISGVYALGSRLGGRAAGLWSAGAAAALPLLWWAGREARMYTLLALLAVLCAYALARLMAPRAGRDGRWWALLAICELGLLYAHNTGPVAFVWVNIVVLAGWLARRGALRPGWRTWLAVQGVVALAWAPYFITRFLLLPEANASVVAAPLSAADIRESLAAFFVVPWEAAVEASSPVWSILLLALAALGTGAPGAVVRGHPEWTCCAGQRVSRALFRGRQPVCGSHGGRCTPCGPPDSRACRASACAGRSRLCGNRAGDHPADSLCFDNTGVLAR
jgi:4-amino-4-deoxy-L-arabinose transferase-like glycosyltransferase